MVILATDFMCIPILKTKSDPQPVIDPNAVASFLVTLQRLQPISGRHTQIVEFCGGIYHIEFASHYRPDVLLNFPRRLRVFAVEQVLGRWIRKRLDHGTLLLHCIHVLPKRMRKDGYHRWQGRTLHALGDICLWMHNRFWAWAVLP